MNILILFSQPWRVGGAETHVTDLVKGLRSKGHIVYLAIHGENTAAKLEGIAAEQWLFNFRSANPFEYVAVGIELAKRVKEYKIDMIHAHQRTAGYLGAFIKRQTGIPFVVTIHDPWERALFKKSHSLIFDHIITVSEFLRKRFISTFGFDAGKVHTIYNGVNQYCYDAAIMKIETLQEIRNDLGILPHYKVISLIARLYASKGHQYLIEAAPEIIKHIPNVRFLFVGSGDHEERFKKQISKLGIDKYFIFAGYREDIPELIAVSDIVVRPSDMEGLPINLIEAMLMEKPVVATAIAGVPEMIESGVNGYMMQPGSITELAQKLIDILENEEVAVSMGQKGRQIALEKFTLQSLVDKVEELYQSIQL